jgi:hypothetical protein
MGRGDAMTAVSPEACPACLETDVFRESRKSVAIATLNRALCDILCGCPRGTRLRVL